MGARARSIGLVLRRPSLERGASIGTPAPHFFAFFSM
jgi:hypothetical protein